MAAPPKLDLKMVVAPVMMLLSRYIDFKNEANMNLARQVFISVSVVMLSLHALAYLQLGGNKKRDVTIWVPPKAKPVLPFGLGPPAEEVKAEDYTETTYSEYEMKLLRESAQGIVMSFGITMLMSFKFNIHVSLAVQSVSGPVGLIDSVILKKYILGINPAGGYGEFLKKPTAADLLQNNTKVELKNEKEEVEEKEDKKSTGSKCAEVPVKTDVNEID